MTSKILQLLLFFIQFFIFEGKPFIDLSTKILPVSEHSTHASLSIKQCRDSVKDS